MISLGRVVSVHFFFSIFGIMMRIDICAVFRANFHKKKLYDGKFLKWKETVVELLAF